MEEPQKANTTLTTDAALEASSPHQTIMRKYNQQIIQTTKRLLGRYIIMNKVVTFFLFFSHFCTILASFLHLLHQGYMAHETLLCSLVAPLNTLLYIGINVALMVYFLVHFFQAT